MNKKIISAALGLPLLAAGAAIFAAPNAPAAGQPAPAPTASAGCCAPSGQAPAAACCPEAGAKAQTAATNGGCCEDGPCCP